MTDTTKAAGHALGLGDILGLALAGHISPSEAQAMATLKMQRDALLEACQNMQGLYDTPAERRRRNTDPFYTEAIATLRSAIRLATLAGNDCAEQEGGA